MTALAQWLKDNDLTQEAFGKLVGVSQGRIGQLLSGDEPSLKLARRIKAATNGEVDYLANAEEVAP